MRTMTIEQGLGPPGQICQICHSGNPYAVSRHTRHDQRDAYKHASPLEPDEVTMIRMFADGLCVTSIARRLYMSERTVRRRARGVCDRLGVDSMIQVVAWAARSGLI